jgi:hypothetical protein
MDGGHGLSSLDPMLDGLLGEGCGPSSTKWTQTCYIPMKRKVADERPESKIALSLHEMFGFVAIILVQFDDHVPIDWVLISCRSVAFCKPINVSKDSQQSW